MTSTPMLSTKTPPGTDCGGGERAALTCAMEWVGGRGWKRILAFAAVIEYSLAAFCTHNIQCVSGQEAAMPYVLYQSAK